MEMLQSNPELQYLRLHCPTEITIDQTLQRVHTTLTFPRLTNIDLAGFPQPSLAAILSSINAPVCGAFSINAREVPDSSTTSFRLSPALLSFLPIFKAHLRDGGGLTLKLGSLWFSWALREASAYRSFAIHLPEVSQVLPPLQWFVVTFMDFEPLSIVLMDDFDLGDEEVTSILWTWTL